MSLDDAALKARAFRTALVVGASRGLGLGLVQEYLERGWHVIATVRSTPAEARELSRAGDHSPARLRILQADVTRADDAARLRAALAGTSLDVLLVNAGVQNDHRDKIGDVSTETFNHVMVSNALGPMKMIETCADLVLPGGVIAVMSSYMGSIALNTTGSNEVYRASKAALNSLLRSFAARHTGNQAVIALHPGWVRTQMGGERAPLDIATSVRGCIDVLSAQSGNPGVRFLNYQGEALAW